MINPKLILALRIRSGLIDWYEGGGPTALVDQDEVGSLVEHVQML